ncbi:flagellar biosynthesis anti-sigma factor FlgM [Halomonas sp. McH1-25]|uniref:flagellar biosynthesis anti-sigma factor FlgM n=1 Tax=unclassified Halomonas TaxID=2609666 RepID=UPI001EF54968|nr:flagellar biosynthesis anti-sigma factor FlgM [Halomonas sp. McH1-25]MCP1340631.1 flagellar biosynthesis anti-sigma factor FlgM [Halomonas sp. FL8]MCP1359402.1 flagellar biosynthesis anti-sigma factor FlgM [Halomonas sp. BBD45]MCP1366709.1 flagellar biosynthesis anti-sigma factor FlgM [Halomonas sp. BBD48]
MKIDSSQPLNPITQGETGKKPQASPTDSATSKTQPATVTHLSDGTNDASKDVDAARVAEIRQAISEGRLDIRAERIADGLIDSVRDLLGDKTS